MQNKYTVVLENPDPIRLKKAKSVLEKYLNTDYTDRTKKEVLEYWPELFTLYRNKSSQALFRGLSFQTENRDDFTTLLEKLVRTETLTSKQVRSWTIDPEVGRGYAIGKSANNALAHDLSFGMVLETITVPNNGLDLIDPKNIHVEYGLKSNIVKEKEFLMPPGSYPVSIILAHFIDPYGKIYFFSEYSVYGQKAKYLKILQDIAKQLTYVNKEYGIVSEVQEIDDLDDFLKICKTAPRQNNLVREKYEREASKAIENIFESYYGISKFNTAKFRKLFKQKYLYNKDELYNLIIEFQGRGRFGKSHFDSAFHDFIYRYGLY